MQKIKSAKRRVLMGKGGPLLDPGVMDPYSMKLEVARDVAPAFEDCMIRLTGDILFRAEDQDDTKKVGYIDGAILDVFDDRLYDVCDSLDGDWEEIGGLLLKADELLQDTSDYPMGPVLFLNKVELGESHRGKGVGLGVARKFINTFQHGCSVAMLKPWPMGANSSRMTASQKKGRDKLARYWGRLGFLVLEGIGFMVLDLNYAQPDLWKGLSDP